MKKQTKLWYNDGVMLIHRFPYAFFFILVFAVACEKDSAPPVDNDPNEPVPYVQYSTPFTGIPDNEDIVMYEVNLRAFSQAGDIQGVRSRLDHIKALGVNVIWLMPIYPIGTLKSVNSPYSVKDFKAVSAEYGTLQSLRGLTDDAHARGMAVMMDWVANHTAWDNAWISNGSWYTKDGSGNITHPPGTNWLDVADLNFDNSNMRKAMIDAMKYWVLEANIDGYRCDYADGVPFDFWKQAIDSLNAIPNRDLIFLAEGNRLDHFTAGFDLNYAWDFYSELLSTFVGQSAIGLFNTHISEYNAIPAGKHKLRFTTNHDESAWYNSPIVIFNGKQGALAASVATTFIGGVPLIYSGQEVGRATTTPFFSNSPIHWDDNPDMLQAYKDIMGFYTQSEVATTGVVVDYSTDEVICFTKTLGDDQLFVLVNTRNAPVEPPVPAELVNLFWSDAFTGDTLQFGATVQLNNYQYIVATR